MKKIYADNASTSFPKAPGVSCAVKNFLDNAAYNISRGGYTGAYDVAMEVIEARQMLAQLFDAPSPGEVVFTPSATYSLNILLRGLLKKGGHVLTTSMEHNAVMRPLHALTKIGVTYDTIPCDNEGDLNPDDITGLIKKETKALVMTHASNVCGTVMPIDRAAQICKKHGIRLIVDAAQTAGLLPISTRNVDALAFAGHKGLLGPGGIGGLVIKQDFAEEVEPLVTGGTGSLSDGIEQPNFLPDKFEAGTLNIPGIIGLKAAVKYINSVGVKTLYAKKMALAQLFISKIASIPGAKIIGKKDCDGRIAVVSLDFPDRDNATIAQALDENFGIMTRCGLHCAPQAHKTLFTYPHGTVRFSFGSFNTPDEVEHIAGAVKQILKKV